MYFTDTPELRKFEREMKQKPNFDRNSYDSDEIKNEMFLTTKNPKQTKKT